MSFLDISDFHMVTPRSLLIPPCVNIQNIFSYQGLPTCMPTRSWKTVAGQVGSWELTNQWPKNKEVSSWTHCALLNSCFEVNKYFLGLILENFLETAGLAIKTNCFKFIFFWNPKKTKCLYTPMYSSQFLLYLTKHSYIREFGTDDSIIHTKYEYEADLFTTL